MEQANPKLLPTLILAFLAIITFAAALWILDHPFPGSMIIILLLMGLVLVFMSWGFIRLLKWRDHQNAKKFRAQASIPQPPRPEDEGTIYGLVPGSNYRVETSFKDYYGNDFSKGEVLRFKERQFLPYHGGHTAVFEQKTLYLQEDINNDIVDNFINYFVRIP